MYVLICFAYVRELGICTWNYNHNQQVPCIRHQLKNSHLAASFEGHMVPFEGHIDTIRDSMRCTDKMLTFERMERDAGVQEGLQSVDSSM